MMSRTVLALAIVVSGVAAALSAQDAVMTLPEAYTLQFENDWVRIERVRYAPFAKLPGHAHTPRASAYVYLNDGGPVIFKHVGKEYGAVTRPATKAGSFRLYRGLDEIHEVENTSPLPSEFLRVELKTDAKAPQTLRGRFFRESLSGPTRETPQFENGQVRITRIVIEPGSGLSVAAPPAEPSLLLALTGARLKVHDGSNGGSSVSLELGEERWVAAGDQERLENAGAEPVELLRFALKTAPLP